MAELNQTPEQSSEEQKEGLECQKESHVLGEVAGGVLLASVIMSCICLFTIAIAGLGVSLT